MSPLRAATIAVTSRMRGAGRIENRPSFISNTERAEGTWTSVTPMRILPFPRRLRIAMAHQTTDHPRTLERDLTVQQPQFGRPVHRNRAAHRQRTRVPVLSGALCRASVRCSNNTLRPCLSTTRPIFLGPWHVRSLRFLRAINCGLTRVLRPAASQKCRRSFVPQRRRRTPGYLRGPRFSRHQGVDRPGRAIGARPSRGRR